MIKNNRSCFQGSFRRSMAVGHKDEFIQREGKKKQNDREKQGRKSQGQRKKEMAPCSPQETLRGSRRPCPCDTDGGAGDIFLCVGERISCGRGCFGAGA